MKVLFLLLFPLLCFANSSREAWVKAKMEYLNAQPNCELWSTESWSKTMYGHYNLTPPLFKVKKEIKIAVIDTGINLKNQLLFNAIPSKYHKNLQALDFSEKQLGLTETIPHGSHVAGIILGIFPHAQILPLKYFDGVQNPEADIKSFIKAVEFAIQERVDIINFSAGGRGYAREEEEVLKRARAKGILVVVAAGNHNENIEKKETESFPASHLLSNLVVVGSHERNSLNKSSYSNYGKEKVHFLASGDNVISFGNTKCQLLKMSGTSMATPFITGIIALLKAQFPTASNEEILAHIENSTTQSPLAPVSKFGAVNLSRILTISPEKISTWASK